MHTGFALLELSKKFWTEVKSEAELNMLEDLDNCVFNPSPTTFPFEFKTDAISGAEYCSPQRIIRCR